MGGAYYRRLGKAGFLLYSVLYTQQLDACFVVMSANATYNPKSLFSLLAGLCFLLLP